MAETLKYKRRIARLPIVAVLMAIASVWAACEAGHPEAVADDGEVMLTLRLSLPGTEEDAGTRAITANEENAINISQLKVLVFKANGLAETFSYEAPPVKLQTGRYVVILKQSRAGERYRLVVIANAGAKLPVFRENAAKSDALKMITFNAAGKWNATGSSNYSPIPMWGETATAQTITPTTVLGSVTLLRALARIDVGCALALNGETAAGLSNFKLKSVSVYRTRNKGYVAPVSGGTISDNEVEWVSIPADAGINGALTYACTDNKPLIRSIYVAETEKGEDRRNNVCLVVGGTYNGSTNYYRVDLMSDGSYIPIKRNCRYGVNITAVNNAGYDTEAKALAGDKTLVIATSISAEAWGGETAAGSGTITLP